jgi:ribosomal protein L7/L12
VYTNKEDNMGEKKTTRKQLEEDAEGLRNVIRVLQEEINSLRSDREAKSLYYERNMAHMVDRSEELNNDIRSIRDKWDLSLRGEEMAKREIDRLRRMVSAQRDYSEGLSQVLRAAADTGSPLIMSYVAEKVAKDMLEDSPAAPKAEMFQVVAVQLKKQPNCDYTFKIHMIKWIRDRKGLGLREAKELVDTLPVDGGSGRLVLETGLTLDTANHIADEVKEWAVVQIEPVVI